MGFELFVITGVELTVVLFCGVLAAMVGLVIYLCWHPYSGRE